MVGDCPWIIPFLWLKIIKWNQQADLCPLTSNNYSSIIQSHWPQDATGNYTCSIVVKDYTPVIWTTCLSFTPSAVFFASRQSSQGTFHGRFSFALALALLTWPILRCFDVCLKRRIPKWSNMVILMGTMAMQGWSMGFWIFWCIPFGQSHIQTWQGCRVMKISCQTICRWSFWGLSLLQSAVPSLILSNLQNP